MEDNVKVSVSCITYNHENYIRKCLDGFLMQKTNFKFEVLIHDDASTDKTQDIIREYTNKYPDIFKPILQTINQYSQGVSITRAFHYPIIKGEYVALCEGDDCWIDENKLQYQADYLDSHPDCFCVAHAHREHSCVTNTDTNISRSSEDRDFTLKEVVDAGGGLFATNALMIRKAVFLEMPDCFYTKNFSDYQIPIHAAILGKVHYINRISSLYNCFVPQSWSSRNTGDDKKEVELTQESITLLSKIDAFYDYKFHDEFSNGIEKRRVLKNLHLHDFKAVAKSKFYKENKDEFRKQDRIKVAIGQHAKWLVNAMVELKRKLKRK